MRNISLVVLLLAFQSVTQAEQLVGQAFDVKTKQTLYQEQHVVSEQDGQRQMQSIFTSPRGDTIATRTVTYEGDQVAAYHMQHLNVPATETVLRKATEISISETSGDQIKSAEVPVEDAKPIIIDAGFSDYILRNWELLRSGEKLKFDFISTAQLDSVKLRVEHVRQSEDVEVFKMTLANPLLRLLMDPIEIGYFTDTKQLAFYQGISNIKDDQGKRYSDIRIEYQRSDQPLASVIQPINKR